MTANINLYEYTIGLLKDLNARAEVALDNPAPYIKELNVENATALIDSGESRMKGNINSRARNEKLAKNAGLGELEYFYAPVGEQRSVKWLLENDPAYFMGHIVGCRNRGRGQVNRMDDLQDFAITSLFGKE